VRFLRDIPIGIKLLIAPAVLVLALAVVSLAAIYGLDLQRRTLSQVNDIALDKITLVYEFIALSEQVQSDVFRISVWRFMELPDEEVQPIQKRMERGLSDLDVLYGQILFEWELEEEERAILERLREPMSAFQQQAKQAVAVVADTPALGVLLVRSTSVPFAEFRSTLSEFLDYQHAKLIRAEAEATRRANRMGAAIVVLALAVALAAIGATVLISRRLIAQPIGFLTALMHGLAEGDHSIEVGQLARGDEIGRMVQALEVFRSGLAQKAQAEEALRESEEKLRGIVEHSTNLFYSHTADHVLTYLSPQTKELLGYEPSEAMVRWTELTTDHPVNLRGLEITQQAIDTGEPQRPYELELRHKEGHEVWVEVREAPLVVDGETAAMVGALTDITERKQAEEALMAYSERLEEMVEERTQELQDAQEKLVRREKLALLGRLAGGVSHDLRNPLGVISNAVYYLNMLQAETNQGAGEKTREYLGVIAREVKNAERIVSSLLDIGRVKSAEVRPVEVADLIAGTMEMCPVPEGVDLVCQIPDGLPLLRVDPQQIARVLCNLLSNAWQSMSKGGEVKVAAEPANGSLSLSVTDQGCGIPPETMKTLFEPLFTTKGRGLGLGLAVSKDLVEANGGRIEVESVVGQGSTFKVYLPIEVGSDA
jgi:PAS domain S-box-containing protein